MLVLARRHRQHHTEYQRICQQQAWLREIAHRLTPHAYGAEAAWEAHWHLWGFVRMLERSAPTEHQSFVQQIATWFRNLGHHLFACFYDAAIPRTDNALEGFFRAAKSLYRRMTGRRNWSAYILRYGPYAVFHESHESSAVVLQHVRTVSETAWRAERRRWQTVLEPFRQYRRFAAHPAAFLTALEQAWFPSSG